MTSKIQALANKVERYPLVQTGNPEDPYLDVVYRYLKGDGDLCDVMGYLEHAESIHALPYSQAR